MYNVHIYIWNLAPGPRTALAPNAVLEPKWRRSRGFCATPVFKHSHVRYMDVKHLCFIRRKAYCKL